MLPPTVSLGVTHERVPGVVPSWRRRFGCGVIALLLLAAAVLFGFSTGSHVLYALPVRVSGRIVDAASGEPVAGVWIAPMRSLSEAGRDGAIRRLQWVEQAYEGGYPSDHGALTGADGRFSFVYRVQRCRFENSWSLWQKEIALGPFEGIRGLLLARPGQEYVEVDTRGGVWRTRPEASLEMGDVRFGE